VPVQRTDPGPELLLRLDRGDPLPLRQQLEGQVRALIRDGRLTVGETMPSSRVLAEQLGISRGVVVDGGPFAVV